MSSDEETSNSQPSTSKSQSDEQNTAEPDTTAGGSEVAKAKASDSDSYICLRLITSDLSTEIHNCLKLATSLGRLKRIYCEHVGFLMGAFCFVFDGHRITDDDTPESLGLVNNDVIEICKDKSGGM